jgi:hypothetical protein
MTSVLRHDVLILVYETEILKDNMTLAGDILAQLQVSPQNGFWLDCVIDVFPSDEPETAEIAPYLKMSITTWWCEAKMRGRFRNSFLNQSLCGKSENSGKYQTARCDAYVQERT